MKNAAVPVVIVALCLVALSLFLRVRLLERQAAIRTLTAETGTASPAAVAVNAKREQARATVLQFVQSEPSLFNVLSEYRTHSGLSRAAYHGVALAASIRGNADVMNAAGYMDDHPGPTPYY